MVVAKNIYDANGNIIKKIDGNGYASASNDKSRYGTSYAYNASNMLISTKLYTYAANTESAIPHTRKPCVF